MSVKKIKLEKIYMIYLLLVGQRLNIIRNLKTELMQGEVDKAQEHLKISGPNYLNYQEE